MDKKFFLSCIELASPRLRLEAESRDHWENESWRKEPPQTSSIELPVGTGLRAWNYTANAKKKSALSIVPKVYTLQMVATVAHNW